MTRIFSLLLCCGIASAVHAQFDELRKAEMLFLRGNYAESAAAYAAIMDMAPAAATVGLARIDAQEGRYDEAIAKIDHQFAADNDSAALHALRGRLSLDRGQLEQCRAHVEKALSIHPENVEARWLQAELWRIQRNIDDACRAYREMAEIYDRKGRNIKSPRELYWLAQALAQHARFNQDKSRFRELTNTVYPRLLALEPNFWPAHCQTGLLLLEKFNSADAESALNDALAINPQAADARVGLARLALDAFQIDNARRHLDRALRANPNHAPAHLCRADLEFASLRPEKALAPIQHVLSINPRHVGALGRLAAAYQLTNVSRESATEPPNVGEFHAAWGAALEQARRYPQAAERFRQAIDSTPQLLGPRASLGMIEMRLGHETPARRWLTASFDRDPYNVRVKNQLEVLELLDEYATLETEHFLIRFDADRDQQLAECMARHAERCYDQLTATFDFQLPEKALLEVFRDGRGVTARDWFGARMVGLPNIHTIAACSGNIVAMVSPTTDRTRRNWADILRHEIVHLINIQQTDYAVPHWLTEGCAVWQENRPRPLQWEKLLVQRVPRGDVFNLQTLNLGFIRPRSPDDWHLAYCQAEIYVDLLVEKFDTAGVRQLLDSYRDNVPLEQAFADRLGISLADFEQAYIQKITQITADLAQRRDLQTLPKLSEATARWEADPRDYPAGAELALVRLRRGDYPEAGRLASEILTQAPKQPLARYVKARLLARIGDEDGALETLDGIADAESPELQSLQLVANIHARRGEWPAARRLYSLGQKHQPHDLQWTKALAVVALKQNDTANLKKLLTRIAEAEPDNLIARRKLLQLAIQHKQPQEIAHWTEEVLHIDPNYQNP